MKKPVWTLQSLYNSPQLRLYDKDVILYTLHNAIETGFQLKDRNGRLGYIESKGNMYAFANGKFNTLQDRYIKPTVDKYVPLITIDNKDVDHHIDIETKRKSFKWVMNDFSNEVLDWYIVDHILTDEERLEHMIGLDWSSPPVYAKILKVDNMLILGSKQIFIDGVETTLIGEQLDKYNKWLKERMDLFISTRSGFFATMNKNKSIIFNLDETSDVLKPVNRVKRIGGRACGSFLQPLLNLFAEWLGGTFGKDIKTTADRCQYLSLLVRDAIIKNKEGIVWWTPEEWAVFAEDQNTKELLNRQKV
jgi:hypothetical protein